MRDLHFAAPQNVHWIWLLLAVVVLLVWLEGRGSAALGRFLSESMKARLVVRPSRTRRLLRIGLLGLCGLALIVALMRPQFGMRFVRTPRVGAELMVCLDVSKSMLAADVAPNRLERAKVEVEDLLRFLDGDHVGLIAFAGKATVLCPLTPDFGFLKLSLRNAGPQSVARGGTNLEAPIRKAIEGFRGEADVARAILLITDGEDHDSFPLEAAKAAAERGIRILAIGFGDESGSEIQLTDPRTGARVTLRDAEGRPVVSRLDGETLREMALATGGAYIPAGTGALDLESIHEAHIARLTRGELDGRGRLLRSEGFQWAVLAALILLVASVAVTGTRPRVAALGSAARATSLLAGFLLLFLGLGGTPARADDEGPDARARYNEGVAAFEVGDLDEAVRHFEAARRAGGPDGEARYAAAYDLGWVEVRRADATLGEEPEEALEHLRAAADWFGDAVRLRPERDAARHNLDVVTRRILELADALAKQDPRDVAAEIDALIAAQRALMPELGVAVGREREAAEDPARALQRGDYRGLAVAQRQVLADLNRLAAKVREEADALAARADEEQSTESKVRQIQLTNASHFLERANQRLGQGRSQLRRKQAARAFRRGFTGLDELKRGRDQFRPPVEMLDMLIGEGMQLVRWTGALAAAEIRPAALGGEDLDAPPPPPSWLDVDFLRERQVPQSERLAELVVRLEAGIEGQEASVEESVDPGADPRANPRTEAFVARVREALPFLKTATTAYDEVSIALDQEDPRTAVSGQGEALTALLDARERFLDLKGLIELAYVDEVRLQRGLEEVREAEDVPLEEVLPLLAEMQRKNLGRVPRLQALMGEEAERLAGEASPPTEGEDEAAREAARERLRLAGPLLQKAKAAMEAASAELEVGAPAEGADVVVAEAVEHLEELRRLYFTVVEHLRETHRRQLQLNDETQAATVLEDQTEQSAALGPVEGTQVELRALTQAIREALEKQASKTPQGGGVAPETLRGAAALVGEGGTAMDAVLESLRAEPPALELAREEQDVAAEKLAEALALLQPPQQGEQPEDQPQPEPQDGDQEEEQEKKEEADPTRLLQAVRDREAKRRREQEKRRAAGYEPVEKDW